MASFTELIYENCLVGLKYLTNLNYADIYAYLVIKQSILLNTWSQFHALVLNKELFTMPIKMESIYPIHVYSVFINFGILRNIVEKLGCLA